MTIHRLFGLCLVTTVLSGLFSSPAAFAAEVTGVWGAHGTGFQFGDEIKRGVVRPYSSTIISKPGSPDPTVRFRLSSPHYEYIDNRLWTTYEDSNLSLPQLYCGLSPAMWVNARPTFGGVGIDLRGELDFDITIAYALTRGNTHWETHRATYKVRDSGTSRIENRRVHANTASWHGGSAQACMNAFPSVGEYGEILLSVGLTYGSLFEYYPAPSFGGEIGVTTTFGLDYYNSPWLTVGEDLADFIPPPVLLHLPTRVVSYEIEWGKTVTVDLPLEFRGGPIGWGENAFTHTLSLQAAGKDVHSPRGDSFKVGDVSVTLGDPNRLLADTLDVTGTQRSRVNVSKALGATAVGKLTVTVDARGAKIARAYTPVSLNFTLRAI